MPTHKRELLATPYGLLWNELHRSPETVTSSVIALLRQALDLDTGDPSQTTTPITLYIIELACTVENYIHLMANMAAGTHESYSHLTSLRDSEVLPSVEQHLHESLRTLQTLLHVDAYNIVSHWVDR